MRATPPKKRKFRGKQKKMHKISHYCFCKQAPVATSAAAGAPAPPAPQGAPRTASPAAGAPPATREPPTSLAQPRYTQQTSAAPPTPPPSPAHRLPGGVAQNVGYVETGVVKNVSPGMAVRATRPPEEERGSGAADTRCYRRRSPARVGFRRGAWLAPRLARFLVACSAVQHTRKARNRLEEMGFQEQRRCMRAGERGARGGGG